MGMGHDLRDGSQSPVRVWQSSRWKSPSQRERSPERHKSSRRDGSPARKKRPGRDQSPKREMPSAASPLARHRNSQRDRSPPARETNFTHAKSPMHEKSHSPSPRTKRLRRAQGERETENANDKDHGRNNGRGEDSGTHRGRRVKKMTERESDRINIKGGEKRTQRESEVTDRDYERNHGRGSDKNSHRERGINRDTEVERKERRSGRDETDGKSSRARRVRSISPSDNHRRSWHKSRSPQLAAGARECDEMADARRAERQNSDDDSLAKMKTAEEALEAKQKQKPSFELSGKLAAETNRVKGVTLLFNEPPDARTPDLRWQLFVFKGGELLNEPLYIHRQSCYLFGRERRVADIPTDHPSCSKQHAVLQFRQVEKEEPDGALSKQVRPYLMDLGSTNKTFINDNPIEPQRYYELFEKDTIKFGNSSREYVLLHENSAG